MEGQSGPIRTLIKTFAENKAAERICGVRCGHWVRGGGSHQVPFPGLSPSLTSYNLYTACTPAASTDTKVTTSATIWS